VKKKPYTPKIKLSSLESFIIDNISEAGSETIETISIMIYNRCLCENNLILSNLDLAIQHLLEVNMINLSTRQYLNYQNIFVPVDKDNTQKILDYLKSCPWKDWYVDHKYGPCNKIEICKK
jgi:hypothetical protein